jgi:hypothetical protein
LLLILKSPKKLPQAATASLTFNQAKVSLGHSEMASCSRATIARGEHHQRAQCQYSHSTADSIADCCADSAGSESVVDTSKPRIYWIADNRLLPGVHAWVHVFHPIKRHGIDHIRFHPMKISVIGLRQNRGNMQFDQGGVPSQPAAPIHQPQNCRSAMPAHDALAKASCSALSR